MRSAMFHGAVTKAGAVASEQRAITAMLDAPSFHAQTVLQSLLNISERASLTGSLCRRHKAAADAATADNNVMEADGTGSREGATRTWHARVATQRSLAVQILQWASSCCVSSELDARCTAPRLEQVLGVCARLTAPCDEIADAAIDLMEASVQSPPHFQSVLKHVPAVRWLAALQSMQQPLHFAVCWKCTCIQTERLCVCVCVCLPVRVRMSARLCSWPQLVNCGTPALLRLLRVCVKLVPIVAKHPGGVHAIVGALSKLVLPRITGEDDLLTAVIPSTVPEAESSAHALRRQMVEFLQVATRIVVSPDPLHVLLGTMVSAASLEQRSHVAGTVVCLRDLSRRLFGDARKEERKGTGGELQWTSQQSGGSERGASAAQDEARRRSVLAMLQHSIVFVWLYRVVHATAGLHC